MAARFAVTTGNWNDAIWAATSGGAAGSAAVPTAADDATVNKNVEATVDTTTCVAKSVTLSVGTTGSDVGGKLAWSTVANSKLTVEEGFTNTGASGSSGAYGTTWQMDLSAAPTVAAELVLNNSRAASPGYGITNSGLTLLKGAPRTRRAYTLSALTANSTTSVDVDDATGWRVGDRIVFATTQAYNATPRVDVVTIASLTLVSGTRYTVTWSDGAGTGGAVLYAHATDCLVCNFSSNVIIRTNTNGDRAWWTNAIQYGTTSVIRDVEDRGLYSNGGNPCACTFAGNNSGLTDFSNNAFYDFYGRGTFYIQLSGTFTATRRNNIYYSANNTSIEAVNLNAQITIDMEDEENLTIVRSKSIGVVAGAPNINLSNPLISACIDGALTPGGLGARVTGGHIWSNQYVTFAVSSVFAPFKFTSTGIGTRYSGAVNANIDAAFNDLQVTYDSCPLDTTGANFIPSGITSLPKSTQFTFINKNNDASLQEIYRKPSASAPVVKRDGSPPSGARSTSALLLTCSTSAEVTHEFNVLAKAGQTVRIICRIMKSGTPSYGVSTLPKITVSGLGITPVVGQLSGGTAADTWETITVDATNGGSSDGQFTVTFSAQSSTAGAKAWFGGVPVAPFVSRARHYGYLFDETIPTRTANVTVSASESTAAAYTGMTVTWGSSSSSLAVTGDNTFQQVYDYTQAQACLNVGSALPLTGAGVAGSPSLFAAGDVTVSSGKVLNGAGSLSMGSNVLSAQLNAGQAYTYTGGTFSRLTTLDTFSGGTLNIGAAGTYVFSQAASMILSMTPTAPGTYALGGVSFTGTVDLRNAAAHAITVELPSGVSYTTANNVGGTITVSTPQLYQSVTVSGAVTGSGLELYDITNDEQLYNDVPSSWPYVWTDADPAAVNREIRMRLTYEINTGTAKRMIEEVIGTCGTAEGDKDISRAVTQEDDLVYIAHCNALGITGEDVTDIEIDDAANKVKFNYITGGDYDARRIYIYMVYWLHTNAGREDDFVFCDPLDAANLPMEGVLFENISSPKETITFINAYVYDKDTGRAKDLIYGDGINFAPDHVVNNIVTVGGANIITGDIDEVAGKVLAAAAASPIKANIKYVNDVEIAGTGVTGDTWGPV